MRITTEWHDYCDNCSTRWHRLTEDDVTTWYCTPCGNRMEIVGEVPAHRPEMATAV